MHNATLHELSAALHKRTISARELTDLFLQRIETHRDLNAFISVLTEQAQAQADRADQLLATGAGTELTGIPIAHKDLFCTAGVKTSCGSRMLDSFVSPYDATVVERLAQAGCVVLGKANMDEFAMGSSTETSWYGAAKNPWDVTRSPGGSSGGSAVAVAARLAPAATGTDTGGSIRQPAALCGISGLKPTYGRVSRYGMVAFASSLDQAGPMAKTAADCALLLEAMAGLDERDSTSMARPVDNYCDLLEQPLAGLRIGLPKEYLSDDLDAKIAAQISNAIEEFKRLGCSLQEISLPNQHLAVPVYYVVASAECSSNLSRFDGVRFGHRAQSCETIEQLYRHSRSEGFGPEVQRRILIGTYVLSSGYYDAYYLKAQKARHMISDDFAKAFEQVDVILGPTAPTTAFPLGEKFGNPVEMYLNDLYTISSNLAGLPAMSIPCGLVDGLPVGLQLIGRAFDEARLLGLAHQFQQQTDWHARAPQGTL